MENTIRCPNCFKVPEVKMEENKIILTCPKHHMAMGDTLEMAKTNWNIYVTFVAKGV